MPEGHSIHRVAQHFSDVFLDLPVEVTSPQGRFTAGAAALNNRTPVSAEAYGKHFFLHFDHGLVLNVHLGMYGAWSFGTDAYAKNMSSIGAPRRIGEDETPDSPITEDADTSGVLSLPEPRPTTRVRIVNEHAWADLVGASICRVLTPDEFHGIQQSIGPDPLRDDADPQRFYDFATRTTRRIGSILMDQKRIGGIGNIYRAEGLFRAGINPHTPSKKLSRQALHSIWADQVHLLNIGVETGKIITTEPEHRPGIDREHAWPEHANYVYQRRGELCRVCGKDSIIMEELEARKLYWCTVCQS